MTPAEVLVLEDGETESLAGGKGGGKAEVLTKRKAAPALEQKDEWTDESDGFYESHKPHKRGRTAVSKGQMTDSGREKARAGATGKRTSELLRSLTDCGDIELVWQDGPGDEMPDYGKMRRQKFDRDREGFCEGALKIPPDYSDVYFSDDDRPARLATRPRFDEKSGIMPSRPYLDIELQYSAGVIPAPIAQYLRDYQIDGVSFLHQLFVYQKGGILGDDMGLGKTVQVAAFLTAAFGKTADERDKERMRKMRRAGDRWYPKVLVVCPGSIIANWKKEMNRWGWWQVDVYHGAGKEEVLQAAKSGRVEIVVTTYMTYKKNCDAVNQVQWDCVVADECHIMKERSSETTLAMNEVNALCRIGLTGTAIQNRYEELWTLLNWTNPGHFGDLSEWNESITKPLKVGQSHDATLKQLSIARSTAKRLVQNLLPRFFLRRMKTLIAHQLPKKSDKVVFCPLTGLQSEAYQNFVESEEVDLIKSIAEPCPCGSAYKKGLCCYKTLPNGKSWIASVFPCIVTLQKLANHVTLLIPAAGATPNGEKQQRELAKLRTCLPNDWEDLYKNRESLLNLANPEFCGKWKILRKLLKYWHENGDKVLVFSHSVRLLHILQHLFHNTSYSVSYLDGSLGYEERQRVVDDFDSDPAKFVFLISTKAGGVGLNITSANKVVIFDPHWNPSHDLQAQDRAYRIGQVRDVHVFRLVCAGTIEEIVYARQIYKQQQANIGYTASTERRYFKGVQKDSLRTGEIFGLNNLFIYHGDQIALRDIVNKTNIAEAKAGVELSDIDMDKVVKDEEEEFNFVKQEENDWEDGGMSQLAKLLTAENQQEHLKAIKPKTDVIAAILASAGVEYTHENSQVIGSSKVEAQLSRRAELAAIDDSQDMATNSPLFSDSQADKVTLSEGTSDRLNGFSFPFRYNPPRDVMRRHICSMASDFGFPSATEFALVVEGLTQEQRRNCLDFFYKRREAKLTMLMVRAEMKEKLKWGRNKEMKAVQDDMTDENPAVEDDPVPRTEKAEAKKKEEVAEAGVKELLSLDTEKGHMMGAVCPDPHTDVRIEKEKDEAETKAAVVSEMTAVYNMDKRASMTFLSDDEEDDDEL